LYLQAPQQQLHSHPHQHVCYPYDLILLHFAASVAPFKARRHHSSSCTAIHINMCVARPSLSSPWQLLQAANAFLLPQLPLFLNGTDIKRVQVSMGDGRVGGGLRGLGEI
jgi:hypothetical protein